MYFDSNDEFVLEEDLNELCESETLDTSSKIEADEQFQKYLMKKFCIVSAFFGSEDLEKQGTTKITKTIFEGTRDREGKAIVFLDNMSKIRSSSQNTGLPQIMEFIDENASFDTRSNTTEAKLEPLLEASSQSQNYQPEEESTHDDVLLNMSPQKFENQKDQLFLDFFSMYTRQFVDESKERNVKNYTSEAKFEQNYSKTATPAQ